MRNGLGLKLRFVIEIKCFQCQSCWIVASCGGIGTERKRLKDPVEDTGSRFHHLCIISYMITQRNVTFSTLELVIRVFGISRLSSTDSVMSRPNVFIISPTGQIKLWLWKCVSCSLWPPLRVRCQTPHLPQRTSLFRSTSEPRTALNGSKKIHNTCRFLLKFSFFHSIFICFHYFYENNPLRTLCSHLIEAESRRLYISL